MVEALEIAMVLLGVYVVSIPVRELVVSLRAGHRLRQAVWNDAADLQTLREQLTVRNVDAATDVVRKHFGELPKAERHQLEEAFGQFSPRERAGYLRRLAT